MVTIQPRCLGTFSLPHALSVVPSGAYPITDPDSGEEHTGTLNLKEDRW